MVGGVDGVFRMGRAGTIGIKSSMSTLDIVSSNPTKLQWDIQEYVAQAQLLDLNALADGPVESVPLFGWLVGWLVS